MPEGPEIRRAADRVAAAIKGRVADEVFFAFDALKVFESELSGRRVEEMEAGARVAVMDEKRNPADFAIWKKAEPEHILQWDSPWGRGRPGLRSRRATRCSDQHICPCT